MWRNLREHGIIQCWVKCFWLLCYRSPGPIVFVKHWFRDGRLNVMESTRCFLLKTQVYWVPSPLLNLWLVHIVFACPVPSLTLVRHFQFLFREPSLTHPCEWRPSGLGVYPGSWEHFPFWLSWLKDVMRSKLVHWDSFLRFFFVRLLGKKVLILLGLMRRSDTILMNFPLPITADKNKSSVDLVICPFHSNSGAVEATSGHLLRRICFRETYTRN